MRSKCFLAAVLAGACLAQIPAEVKPALDAISADPLKAHVSFLASDLLEGRSTPSRGLDIAAEYIAAQFRRAGLEPAGNDGYFQTAKLQRFEPDLTGFKLIATDGTSRMSVPAGKVDIVNCAAVDLIDVDAVSSSEEDGKGKALIVRLSDLRDGLRPLRNSGAALIIVTGSRTPVERTLSAPEDRAGAIPTIFMRSDAIRRLASKPGAKITAHIAAPKQESVTLRNVAALVRGSDPALKETYVLVTAHYDHIGINRHGADRINNGANDDASGTASMIEIAAALHSLPRKPKRSILFIAFFGEETGGTGSTYYGRHPLVPLSKTVADINLEQLGRTDDPTGPKLNSATLTGFDFSGVPEFFVRAGELTGIQVYKDEKRSDPFFSRSDNQMLADRGIPSHTMCVAFEFPDYHDVGDEWPKLDYANMAKVDRMVALGVWMMAESEQAPQWNHDSAGAAPYIEAAEKLRAETAHAASH